MYLSWNTTNSSTALNPGDGMSFELSVTPNVENEIHFEINSLDLSKNASIQILETNGSEQTVLTAVPIKDAEGLVIPFTPHSGKVKFVLLGPIKVWVRRICAWHMDWVEEDQLVTICDGDKDKYRFGFNGQEKVNEWAGIGNYLDFGARGLDTRVGRFLSIDPMAKKFPSESNYIFAGNSPIYFIDKDGKYKVSAANKKAYTKDYPLIMKYLSTQVESNISNSNKIINGLIKTNPNIKSSTVKGITKWGFGPEIVFKDAPGEFPMEFKGAAGYTEKDEHVIQLNAGYAKYVEKVLSSKASQKVKQAVFTRFYMTLVHETAHELNKYGTYIGKNEQGHDTYKTLPNGYSGDEQGLKAEENIWGTDKYKPFSKPSLDNSEGEQGISSEKYQKGATEGVINEANKTEEGKKSLPTVPTQ